MVGPKLVKKLQCEPAYLFSMLQVAMHAAGEGLRAGDHDLGFFPLFVRGLRKRHFRGGEFVEQAFTNTHAWRNHGAKTQPPGDSDQNDGGDAHNLCAVAAHSEGSHPAFHVEAQNLQEALPQQPRVERSQAAESGTGGQRGESLRIAATSDGQGCCGPRGRRWWRRRDTPPRRADPSRVETGGKRWWHHAASCDRIARS